MLKDRVVLIEERIVELKRQCAEMYKQCVMLEQEINPDYQTKKNELHLLVADHRIVNDMIDEGWL